jgi:glutamine synthetase
VRQQIDASGVTYIYYQFISVTGRIMGKGVPAAHWETMARKGFQLVYGATANLFVDRHGEYIGYGPEAAELVGLPEPETFRVLPWDSKVARVWCTCFRGREDVENGGSYLTSDCRNNLKLIQADFTKRTGMHLRAGLEPEMIWLKADEDGKPTFEGMSKPYCYHIDQFSQFQPIIHKVIEYANAMGLDMIQGDHEDAPGQLELNFNFDVAERTADNLSTYRQVCKQVGREMQAFPCFMPKPFMGVSANGCHHNISLWEGDDNMFMPRARRGSAHAQPDRRGDRRHPRHLAR